MGFEDDYEEEKVTASVHLIRVATAYSRSDTAARSRLVLAGRSIPTCAGQTGWLNLSLRDSPVHPHPAVDLDEEDVVALVTKGAARIAERIKVGISRVVEVPISILLPDNENCTPRRVFPARHEIEAQRPTMEIRIVFQVVVRNEIV